VGLRGSQRTGSPPALLAALKASIIHIGLAVNFLKLELLKLTGWKPVVLTLNMENKNQ
jgi:hypothetical protein